MLLATMLLCFTTGIQITQAQGTITINSNASNSQTEEVPVTTNPDGSYEYNFFNIEYPLTYDVEASWDGDPSYTGARSGIRTFSTYLSEKKANNEGPNWWDLIPGFPIESIIIGLLLALGLIYMSKKKTTDTFRASK
jgi:hypothetical protein